MKHYYFYRRRNKISEKRLPYYFDTTKRKNYIFRVNDADEMDLPFLDDLTRRLNLVVFYGDTKLTDAELIRVITDFASEYHTIRNIEVNKEHSIWKVFS